MEKYLNFNDGYRTEDTDSLLLLDYKMEDIDQMSWEEYVSAHNEIVDDINFERQAEREYDYVYGDDAHESYLMSDEYENDCYSEKYDWIKNA
jgi:hypothetical protein